MFLSPKNEPAALNTLTPTTPSTFILWLAPPPPLYWILIPTPEKGAVTQVVLPLGPSVYADSSTPSASCRGSPLGSAKLTTPRGCSNRRARVPWVDGQYGCGVVCTKGEPNTWTIPNRAQSRASPVHQQSWGSRRHVIAPEGRVQTSDSPGGHSVRVPQPPQRGLEDQVTHCPPHTRSPTHTTSQARARWWQALASHDLATVAVTSQTEGQ